MAGPGTDIKFKIEATGVDLTFQWQKDGKTDLSDDEKYHGTITDTLHIVEVEKGYKGRYRCRVSNYTGETFSEEAFLTVSKLVIHVIMCFTYLQVTLLWDFLCIVLDIKSILMNGVRVRFSENSSPQITVLSSQSIHLSSLNTHTACQ